MAFRIEILQHTGDEQADLLLKRFGSQIPLKSARFLPVYTVDKAFDTATQQDIASHLANPVTQAFFIHGEESKPEDQYFENLGPFDWALEIGFLPGVTDNTGTTAREIIEDLCETDFADGEGVYSSVMILLQGALTEKQVQRLASHYANPLIQRIHLCPADAFKKQGGMEIVVPQVHLEGGATVSEVDLNVSDEELLEIGTKGIADPDGSRRGPLGLSLDYMKAIQAHFKIEGRHPTDIELETLAQTWSEHCKHTIFASAIDEIEDGLYRHYIKRATQDIRKAKGKDDFCVSVFTDNSGAIEFDDKWLITDKAETHNSPSALDPFGGAITGIVGVNRDTIGFGQGAKPVINRYGYCFADPRTTPELYRGKGKTNPMLSPETIMEGVIHGVNVGGNCSGIPTPQGFAYFDERYGGKPLVFVGTVGLIPREVNGQPSHEKKALPGDLIVMVGGKVGKDGIHGATFSSVALDEGSPATAVQIGDPITQKKFSDAIIKEARDQDLYHAITDNGAGGLSSSVGEMAEQSGGFRLDLKKVPTKYPGMDPWEIWISESQERMTLAIAPDKWQDFHSLMQKRGVDAWVIGEFTDSGRAVIEHDDKVIMDMDMAFLHDGLPPKHLKTRKPSLRGGNADEAIQSDWIAALPAVARNDEYNEALLNLLSSLNICSKEFIATQYDHEVQAGSVLKPLQGKGRVYSEATVTRPVLTSKRGAVTAQGLIPRYSDLDTYHMAACSIDTAIRNAVAVGANPGHLAIMDNFCWCSSTEPERLYELKRAAEACYDYATAFGTPFISGKDSMFNDFNGYDANDNPIKISVPPTLLISALGVIPDIEQAVSLDVKMPGDLVYILGETKDELGGSEYLALHHELGDTVPQVDAGTASDRYHAYYKAVTEGLVASAIPVNLGGLGAALAKTAIAGQLGLEIDLGNVPANGIIRNDTLLFSESQSRLLVTVAPEHQTAFEACFMDQPFACIGAVTEESNLKIKGADGKALINAKLDRLEEAYKAPLREY